MRGIMSKSSRCEAHISTERPLLTDSPHPTEQANEELTTMEEMPEELETRAHELLANGEEN